MIYCRSVVAFPPPYCTRTVCVVPSWFGQGKNSSEVFVLTVGQFRVVRTLPVPALLAKSIQVRTGTT